MHFNASPKNCLGDLDWKKRGDSKYNDTTAYCDSKLHNIWLSNAVARLWPDVQSNSLDPGWVATKMGGASAPGSVDAAVSTYVHLAEGKNKGSGKYYVSSKERDPMMEALDPKMQDGYLQTCNQLTGVQFPV
jgi:NAD(P)-dependent dehydrogenase (short-subunit alcohol dehydrogenase family)